MDIAKAAATTPANTLKEAFRRIVIAIPGQHIAKAIS
jgi:hypothetical protein